MLATHQSETYKRHRPETTLLYQLIERYYPEFTANLAEQGKQLPKYVKREFDEFLRCGRLEHGFLRVVCGDCKHDKLIAFSCKRRGFCPSCGARRMAESAALLVDDVLQGYPNRQWVLSLPIPLRLLLALTRFGLPASSAYSRLTASFVHKSPPHNVGRIVLDSSTKDQINPTTPEA